MNSRRHNTCFSSSAKDRKIKIKDAFVVPDLLDRRLKPQNGCLNHKIGGTWIISRRIFVERKEGRWLLNGHNRGAHSFFYRRTDPWSIADRHSYLGAITSLFTRRRRVTNPYILTDSGARAIFVSTRAVSTPPALQGGFSRNSLLCGIAAVSMITTLKRYKPRAQTAKSNRSL